MHFPDELFAIIKEFAGIYSVGTKFNVSKVSKEKLLEYYKKEFHYRIPNPTKYKADCIKRFIMKQIRFKMTRDKWVALYQLCNPIKITQLEGKKFEEIAWTQDGEKCLGLIVGHYKNSYKVKRYKTEITNVETLPTFRIPDPYIRPNLVDNITYTTHTYIKHKYYPHTYNVEDWCLLSSRSGHLECFHSWTHVFNPNKPYELA